MDQLVIPLSDIFHYSHHSSALYCIMLWGEILSWSLMGVKGLTQIIHLLTLFFYCN